MFSVFSQLEDEKSWRYSETLWMLIKLGLKSCKTL